MDINYINELLKQGKTVKEIREIIGYTEKKFQKEIKELGYKWNQGLKQYTLIGKCNTTCNTECNTSDLEPIEIISNTNVQQIEYNSLQTNTLDYLTNNLDVLKLIIEKFSNLDTKVNTDIVIKLDNTGNTLTSIRVNTTILNKFNSFCENNKAFKKSDLISMALAEYIDKYSKRGY